MLAERAQLYQAIGRVTGARWIVDGGKEPIFGALLARGSAGAVGTIHLVRDPRAVAYSWQKLVSSDSEPGYMTQKAVGKTAVHWVSQNLLVQLGLQRLGTAYVRVRYEDMAYHPEEVLRRIFAGYRTQHRSGRSNWRRLPWPRAITTWSQAIQGCAGPRPAASGYAPTKHGGPNCR